MPLSFNHVLPEAFVDKPSLHLYSDELDR